MPRREHLGFALQAEQIIQHARRGLFGRRRSRRSYGPGLVLHFQSRDRLGQPDFRVGLTNLIEAAKKSARGELQEQLDAALATDQRASMCVRPDASVMTQPTLRRGS